MKMRDPQRQICPWFEKAARAVSDTVRSKSQSAKTNVAFFPPSSSDIFLKRGAAMAAIDAPVAVPPVNETALTRGSAIKGSPMACPGPCKILITPAGIPASVQSCEK